MKEKPSQLDVVQVKRAKVNGLEQVRYRVYQSPSEYIAVIAESALLAIRLSGVKNPHKVVRDLPTTGAALEKGDITVPESAEMVHLPLELSEARDFKVETFREQETQPFVEMGLAELYKDGSKRAGVLSRDVGVNMFGVADNAPTLTASPQSARPLEAPTVAEEPLSVAPPEPKINMDSGVLSQDDIAKLLGDI